MELLYAYLSLPWTPARHNIAIQSLQAQASSPARVSLYRMNFMKTGLFVSSKKV